MSVSSRLLAICLSAHTCGSVQSSFKQGRVTHFILSASFFSSASLKRLERCVHGALSLPSDGSSL